MRARNQAGTPLPSAGPAGHTRRTRAYGNRGIREPGCADTRSAVEVSVHLPRRTFNVRIAREPGRHLRVDVSRLRSGRALRGPVA